ncbi:MAG: CHC2 zinc finger domain-containing protein [Rickettsiales bacterium]
MDNSTKEKGRSLHTATLENKQSYHSKLIHKSQLNFDKSSLMSPPVVLDALGIRYRRAGARLEVYCPFHKGGEERNPSLMMDAKDGHYKCFTCGEKGGDVISFYRAVTGAGFMEALKVLGVHHG